VTTKPYKSVSELLPADGIQRILILRTAQLREVDWARSELAGRYPNARVGILGTRLKALGAFEDCEQFEVEADWLSPKSVSPLAGRITAFAPDLVVLCLNNDWRVGYERSSRIVKTIDARYKLVAGYNRRWYGWMHRDFVEGPPLIRWLVDASVALLYPLVAIYLLLKPSTPLYAHTPAAKPRSETA